MKQILNAILCCCITFCLCVPILAYDSISDQTLEKTQDEIEVLQTKVNRKNEKSPAKFTRPKMGITKQAGEKSHRQPG